MRLAVEQGQLERRLTESHLQRPDRAQVQAHWNQFLTIWEVASEEEKAKLLPLIVDRVEMREKERGFCRLWFSLQNPRPRDLATSMNVVIRSQMGAGVGLEPTTSGL